MDREDFGVFAAVATVVVGFVFVTLTVAATAGWAWSIFKLTGGF